MPEGGPQVVPLRLEALDRRHLRRSAQERLHLERQPRVVLRVRAAHARGIRIEVEARGGDLPHRDEHREQGHVGVAVPAEQAPVDELEERAEDVRRPRLARGDRLHGVEAEVAREDAEAHEHRPGVGAEQVDAPLDRGLDRALPLGQVAGRGDEQGKHAVEPGEHRGRGEGADAGGRQLDRERHALERAADAGDVRGVLGGHVEPGVGGPGAIAEEPHGGRLEDGLDGRLRRVRRHGERLDVEHLLPAHAQPRATRHEERRVGQVRQERSRCRAPRRAPARSCRARSGRGAPPSPRPAARRAAGRPRRARRAPVRSPGARPRVRARARAGRTSPGRTAVRRSARPRSRGGSCRSRRGRRG